MNENNILSEVKISAEEVLGPQKIDIIGVWIMSLVSLIIGLFISTWALFTAFVSGSSFGAISWIQPFILAMSTFFVLTLASLLYVFIAKSIFPTIYHRTSQSFKYITIFMIVLYFSILPVYLLSAWNQETSAILLPYLLHIMFAIFGIELLLGVISSYRYVILSFFSNIIAFMISSSILLFLSKTGSSSTTHIFVLMGLAALTFFLSSTIIFLVKFLYYKFYTLTGNDPLGSVFADIEYQENLKLQNAKNSLFQK